MAPDTGSRAALAGRALPSRWTGGRVCQPRARQTSPRAGPARRFWRRPSLRTGRGPSAARRGIGVGRAPRAGGGILAPGALRCCGGRSSRRGPPAWGGFSLYTWPRLTAYPSASPWCLLGQGICPGRGPVTDTLLRARAPQRRLSPPAACRCPRPWARDAFFSGPGTAFGWLTSARTFKVFLHVGRGPGPWPGPSFRPARRNAPGPNVGVFNRPRKRHPETAWTERLNR